MGGSRWLIGGRHGEVAWELPSFGVPGKFRWGSRENYRRLGFRLEGSRPVGVPPGFRRENYRRLGFRGSCLGITVVRGSGKITIGWGFGVSGFREGSRPVGVPAGFRRENYRRLGFRGVGKLPSVGVPEEGSRPVGVPAGFRRENYRRLGFRGSGVGKLPSVGFRVPGKLPSFGVPGFRVRGSGGSGFRLGSAEPQRLVSGQPRRTRRGEFRARRGTLPFRVRTPRVRHGHTRRSRVRPRRQPVPTGVLAEASDGRGPS